MYNDTLKRLYDAKQYGFNFIHPVAPNSNSTPWPDWEGFLHYLDVAEQLGIWIMYDMRYSESVCSPSGRGRTINSVLIRASLDQHVYGNGAGDGVAEPV
jgi:hypothetical protein